MLQLTFERSMEIVPRGQILAVTTRRYAETARKQLPELAEGNLLVEPAMRNTAPAVLLVARHIAATDPDGVVAVLPSDHIVLRQREFEKVLKESMAFVNHNSGILCIGATPTEPGTLHRYIQMGDQASACICKEEGNCADTFKIAAMTGKPDAEMATVFFESGEFLWNTGILVFKAGEMCRIFRHHAPDLWELSETCALTADSEDALAELYAEMRSVTIDDILENVPDLWVRRANFGWSNLGSWNSLYEMSPKTREGNATQNTLVYTHNCSGSILAAQGDKLIVAAGLTNYIVADNDNALLICPREKENELRAVIKTLKSTYGERFV